MLDCLFFVRTKQNRTLAETLYDILGIEKYASLDEVKKAFKRLALRYHPDKNPNNPQAEERFKQISNAYTILSDPESKDQYDIRLSGMFSYLKQNPVKEEKDKKEERRKKAAAAQKLKKQREERKILADYEKLMKTPYWIRTLFNVFLVLFGVRFVFHNWFYTEESFAPYMHVIAFFFIVWGNVRQQNMQYTIYLYKNMKGEAKGNLSWRIARNMIAGVFLSIAVGIVSAHLMALYHFKHYSAYTQAKVDFEYSVANPDYVKVNYIYQVNGKQYTKPLDQKYWDQVFHQGTIRIRYSYINPIFAKPVPTSE